MLVKAVKEFKFGGHDNRHFYDDVVEPWLDALDDAISNAGSICGSMTYLFVPMNEPNLR